MTVILKAQPLLDERLPLMQEECQRLKKSGLHPKLVVVLVGDNPASLSYIANKRKLCEKVGAQFELRQFPPRVTPSEFTAAMASINQDPTIHGCIIQLPVAGACHELELHELVTPAKDVDGFHPQNTSELYLGRLNADSLLPCTPKGVMSLLQHYRIPVKGKNAVVIGRSLIVGKPMALLLTQAGATVTVCHSGTTDLAEHTRRADIIVSAVGKLNLLTARHIDPQRKTMVIDVGMNKNSAGKLVGDCDYAALLPVVGGITPVPGGVGPMTVLSLIENLLVAAQQQGKKP